MSESELDMDSLSVVTEFCPTRWPRQDYMVNIAVVHLVCVLHHVVESPSFLSSLISYSTLFCRICILIDCFFTLL